MLFFKEVFLRWEGKLDYVKKIFILYQLLPLRFHILNDSKLVL